MSFSVQLIVELHEPNPERIGALRARLGASGINWPVTGPRLMLGRRRLCVRSEAGLRRAAADLAELAEATNGTPFARLEISYRPLLD